MYCIILPRAWSKMIQLATHFEWFVSSTNIALCLYFFLPSYIQYLTVYYTSKSNNIYPVIKAGKNIFQKSGSFFLGLPYTINAYAQSDQSLCWLLEYFMIVKLLTEHHLEFLTLKGGCRASSESTHAKMSNCWKSHAAA